MTFQATIIFGLGFMSIVVAILNFVRLFSLGQIDWNFAYEFFAATELCSPSRFHSSHEWRITRHVHH